MSIKMTIEVSPAQAVEIAKLLSVPYAPTPTAPIPTAQSAAVQATPAQQMPHVPTAVPVAQTVPTQAVTIAPPVAQMIPTASREYTMDELALAARPICEAGRQTELLNLLHSFTFTDAAGNMQNVQSIQQLPKDSYPAFANGIRALGGKI